MVYLDNSATTAVCPAAVEKATDMMRRVFGNPSSLHTLGFEAEQEMEKARRIAADWLGVSPVELVFTSGGTESNNLAILGGAAAKNRVGRHVVTTAMEHSSVRQACAELERQGWEITRLLPDRDGTVTPEQVAGACRQNTVLVSVMLVNNEIGACYEMEKMAPLIRKAAPQALIHCDAVQAAGKRTLRPARMGVDLLSISGHKLHAPKGVGLLYIRRGARILPRTFGGHQENGLRAGTESTPLIAALGAAIESLPSPSDQQERYERLRRRLIDQLAENDQIRFHLPPGGVPYIVHLSVPGVRSETLLHFLAQREIYVSSGSACAKGQKSPVLTAMGLPDAEIDSALRISFCYENTPDDIDRFTAALVEAASTLARKR
ncbi:MAG: cysteine desulfurase family protein [Acutalibacteraceae bacterium]|jgi:cysteine desulfurase